MYNKGAYDKAAYEKAAYEKAAYEKAAYEKAAYDKAAYDKAAYDKGAYNKGAYDKGAYDKGAYDKGAYDKGAPAAGGASSGATTIASTGSIAAAAAHTGAPLKILCLHGGGMSGPGFERQLSDLRNRFGPLVQLVCPTAPRGVGDAGLWFGDPGKQGAESVGWWDESVTQLRSVIATQGPFDGVLGACARRATPPCGSQREAPPCARARGDAGGSTRTVPRGDLPVEGRAQSGDV
jgi:hypothetical protein